MDGEEVALSTETAGWTQGWSARIGGYSTGSPGFIGLMDEVAIWDRALSGEEARGLYYSALALVPEPGSFVLLALGGLALVAVRRRRRK